MLQSNDFGSGIFIRIVSSSHIGGREISGNSQSKKNLSFRKSGSKKEIIFSDGSKSEYNLEDYQGKPLSEWPLPLQLDFVNLLMILRNLNLVGNDALLKHMDVIERIDMHFQDV